MSRDPEPPVSAYAEGLPPAALRDRVRRVWCFQSGGSPVAPLILPDGCVDLIWDGARLFIAGPDQQAMPAQLAPGATLTGLRLAPGVAHRLLGMPMQALADQRIAAEAVIGPRAGALERRLADGDDPARTLLAAVGARSVQPDPRMAWVFAQLSGLAAPRLPELARQLGLSERSLHRHCLQAFGYGPKVLDRVLRLQRWLRLASGAVTLTRAALDAGYADATHLAHDVRRLTGLTPTSLLRDHGH
ncbi:helix-turn-helix domain-containing protein [Luteimonas sp. TWI1416]|uniref:helix-turn-helix domain-containing protein n=1 Tax=unclassified Luteimonas TaxID=2629088 RepID=UPI0032083D8E